MIGQRNTTDNGCKLKKNRHLPSITKESSSKSISKSEFSLVQEFEKNLEKLSVQPYKADNIYEQISSIMGNKSKYSTVQAAVKDMQDRSGLTAYLKSINNNDSDKTKKRASENNEESISIFKLLPQVKFTVDNYIEATDGKSSIPAIVDKIKSIHGHEVGDASCWNEYSFLNYIKNKVEDIKSRNPLENQVYENLGTNKFDINDSVDASNTDAFFALTPTIVSK